jgi:hypothetical protein
MIILTFVQLGHFYPESLRQMVAVFLIPQTINLYVSLVKRGLQWRLHTEEEWMLNDILQIDPIFSILVEHESDQLLALLGHVMEWLVVEVQCVLDHGLDDFLVIIAIERRLPTEHRLLQNPKWPHITLFVLSIRQKQLWRHVECGADDALALLRIVNAQPIINDLDSLVIGVFEDYVLRLDIPVDDVHVVRVVDAQEDLLEEF